MAIKICHQELFYCCVHQAHCGFQHFLPQFSLQVHDLSNFRSGPLQQCQLWVLSHAVGLKSNINKWLVTLITFVLLLLVCLTSSPFCRLQGSQLDDSDDSFSSPFLGIDFKAPQTLITRSQIFISERPLRTFKSVCISFYPFTSYLTITPNSGSIFSGLHYEM